MKKRMLSMLLCIAMMLSLLPATAIAADDDTTVKGSVTLRFSGSGNDDQTFLAGETVRVEVVYSGSSSFYGYQYTLVFPGNVLNVTSGAIAGGTAAEYVEDANMFTALEKFDEAVAVTDEKILGTYIFTAKSGLTVQETGHFKLSNVKLDGSAGLGAATSFNDVSEEVVGCIDLNAFSVTKPDDTTYSAANYTLAGTPSVNVPEGYSLWYSADGTSNWADTMAKMNAGSYPVYWKVSNTSEATGHTVANGSYTVTISQKALSVKAENTYKTVGTKDPETLSYTITGWEGSDQTSLESTLTGALEYSRTGDDTVTTEGYTITVSWKNNSTPDALSNYSITLNDNNGKFYVNGLGKDGYKVEIIKANGTVNNESDSAKDYIGGYAMVLVYTDADAVFNYDGALMTLDAKDKYKTSGEGKEYAHVYALLVKDGEGTADDANADKVVSVDTYTNNSAKIVNVGTTDNGDVNGVGGTDVSDLVAVSYTYNANNIYTSQLANAMKVMLRADTNNDKIVNGTDVNAVKTVIETALKGNDNG